MERPRRKLEIESPANATFKRLKSLLTSKGIKAEGELILSGRKLIHERLTHGGANAVRSVLLPKGAGGQHDLTWPAGLDITEIELADHLFEELDELGTHAPLLLMKTPEVRQVDPSTPPQGFELVCPVGDPRNLGAIARSARAFGVRRLLLTADAASPFLPKALKASAGAVLDLEIARLPKLSECLNTWSGAAFAKQVFVLDTEGENLRKSVLPESLFLVCGEEGPGIPEMTQLSRLTIPTHGVESLNAAVATSIALYEISSRQ